MAVESQKIFLSHFTGPNEMSLKMNCSDLSEQTRLHHITRPGCCPELILSLTLKLSSKRGQNQPT